MKRSFPTMAENIAAARERLPNVQTPHEANYLAVEMLGSIVEEIVLSMKDIEVRIERLEAAHNAALGNISN